MADHQPAQCVHEYADGRKCVRHARLRETCAAHTAAAARNRDVVRCQIAGCEIRLLGERNLAALTCSRHLPILRERPAAPICADPTCNRRLMSERTRAAGICAAHLKAYVRAARPVRPPQPEIDAGIEAGARAYAEQLAREREEFLDDE